MYLYLKYFLPEVLCILKYTCRVLAASLSNSYNVGILTWKNCGKIHCYCLHKVEVTQVHLPPSRKIMARLQGVERWCTPAQICGSNVAVHSIVSNATWNCSALNGCSANRCVFYSNQSISQSIRTLMQVDNFAVIGQTVAEIWRFFDFSRWQPPPSWIFAFSKF